MKHEFSSSDLLFHVEYLPAFNLATSRAGLPPVLSLTVDGGEVPENLAIDLAITEIGFQETLRPTAGPVRGRIHPDVEDALDRVVRPLHLNLEITGHGDDREEIAVSILPSWYWPHHAEARLSISALVLPGEDRVCQVVTEAFARAKPALDVPSIDHLRTPEFIGQVPRMIYDYLAGDWQIAYTKPKIEMDEWCGGSYQPVRPPAEVLRGDRGQRGEGNCLDLSLLMAGSLEALGMKPVLLFTGEPEDPPEHAMVGWWADQGQRFHPLLVDPAALREKIATGELGILEATGVCMEAHRLDYDEAVDKARERLAEPIHAVDVFACRPPHGTGKPLVLACEPLVQRAIWAGQTFAREGGSEHLETAHVLYGLCEVEGKLTGWLLEQGGGSANEVLTIIEKNLPRGGKASSPIPTNNYQVCLSTARLNARRRNAPWVEESDLLWAILENPSRNIRKILQAAGCGWTRLFEELASRTERPGENTFSHVITPGRSAD